MRPLPDLCDDCKHCAFPAIFGDLPPEGDLVAMNWDRLSSASTPVARHGH
jgi:hypothetical protein